MRSEIIRLQDELLQSTEATRYVAIQRDGLSARLEAEVTEHHVCLTRVQDEDGTGWGYFCSCGKEYAFTIRPKVAKRDLEAAHAAHVNEAVAEALGGQR